MKQRFAALMGILLSAVGCPDRDAPINLTGGKLTRAQLDAITDECGGPRGMARIERDRLVIYPAKDTSITGCVLDALQATGEMTLGEVGNQRHDPPQER